MAERMTRDEFDRRHPLPLIEKDQHQQFLPAGALDFSTVRRRTLRGRLRRLARRLAALSGRNESDA